MSKTFLIDLPSISGTVYCLSFECETQEQCEQMLLDTGLDAECLGELVEEGYIDEKYLH